MKSFKHYLAESVKQYYYVIKLLVKPTDEQLDAIEAHLKKYDLVSMDSPVEVEHNAIDFHDSPGAPIHQIAFITAMPLSPYVVMEALKHAINIAEEYIVVRSSNEPVELEANDCEFLCTIADMAKEKELVSAPKLSTDRFYHKEEEPLLTDLFGDAYNKKLLDYLRSVADERETEHYIPPAPLFSWIDMDKVTDKDAVEAVDFNAEHDTPKPVAKGKGKKTEPVDAIMLGHYGNLDDAVAKNVKVLKNKNGKIEAVSAQRARQKAGK